MCILFPKEQEAAIVQVMSDTDRTKRNLKALLSETPVLRTFYEYCFILVEYTFNFLTLRPHGTNSKNMIVVDLTVTKNDVLYIFGN